LSQSLRTFLALETPPLLDDPFDILPTDDLSRFHHHAAPIESARIELEGVVRRR
jgi:hypothetical protein